MSAHPYLRAYMAGITIPTMLLLVLLTVFIFARHVYDVSTPLERIIAFPMAVAPNAWGLWNIFYVSRHGRRRLPIGFHGAILPFLIAPLAYTVCWLVDFEIPAPLLRVFPFAFPVFLVVFYLVWKHAVAFFNDLLGIS